MGLRIGAMESFSNLIRLVRMYLSGCMYHPLLARHATTFPLQPLLFRVNVESIQSDIIRWQVTAIQSLANPSKHTLMQLRREEWYLNRNSTKHHAHVVQLKSIHAVFLTTKSSRLRISVQARLLVHFATPDHPCSLVEVCLW